MRAYFLFAVAFALCGLGVYVWRAAPERTVNRWFALFTISVSAWALGIAGVEARTSTEFWGRFTFFSASLIPAMFFGFTKAFPTSSDWPPRWILHFSLLAAGTLAALSLFTRLIAYNILHTESGIQRSTGLLYPLFVAYVLVCSFTALTVFLLKWHKARGLVHAQLQYLGIGLLLFAVGATTTNLIVPAVTGQSSFSWLGPYFTLPLFILAGHAIIRHRLLDLRLVIHHGLAHVMIIIGSCAMVVFISKLLVPNRPARALGLDTDLLLAALVALVLLTVPFQRLVCQIVDPYLFRGTIDYASALRNATRRLARLMQPAELAEELRVILESTFFPESFSMLVRDAPGHRLEPLFTDVMVSRLLAASPAISQLLETQRAPSVVLADPSVADPRRHTQYQALRAAGVELIMSLGRRGEVFGTVLLGQRRSGEAYFKGDLVFIESLAELASIALENALLYRQRIQMLEYSDRLLEALDSAVVAVDANGRLTTINPAAARLFSKTDTVRDSNLDSLPPAVAWALALTVGGAWQPQEVEATIETSTRGVLPVILSTAVLHDEQQRVIGALAIVTDLSTVKALEQNQRRMEHLATMARFYAGVAHEIRNPLASISNIIGMLPDRFDDPEYRETASRLVPVEIARIVRLAERLRLMAPSEGGKLSAVALPSLLADIVAIHASAASERGVRIAVNCVQDIPRVSADPGQLIQLFINLIKNAVEAMPDGGNVTIEAFAATEKQTREGRVVVRVLDEGAGIPASIQHKVFQPFFTTKPAGSGLGLSICREIADFHRARLFLLPRKNVRGTVAQVEFPSFVELKEPSTANVVNQSLV